MATPANLPMFVRRGDTFGPREITISTNAGPKDLTGASVRMQVRQTVASPTVLLELSTTNSRISIPAPATQGKLVLEVAAADTAALSFDQPAVYDLEVTYATGRVETLLSGSFTLVKDVSV